MSTRKFRAVFDIGGGVGSSFKKAFGSSERTIDSLGKSIRKLERERKTLGKNIAMMNKLGESTDKMTRRSFDLGRQIDSLRRKQERYNKALVMGGKAQALGSGMMRVGAAGAAALGGAVLGASGVQDSEIRLGSVVDPIQKEQAVKDARKAARAIGLSGLAGLREAYDSQYALNSAGIQGAASQFGSGVIAKVAKITSGAGEEVSEVVATAYNNLGGQIEGDFEDKFTRIGDLLTKVQLKYQIRDFNQLGESMKKGAAIISTYRIETAQGIAALGELNSAGLQGSLAGTGLSAVMRNLTKASDELGFSVVRNAAGNLDLAKTLEGIRDSTSDMDTDERAAVLQRLFGDEGLPAVVAMLKDVDGLTSRFADVATDSVGLVDREIVAFSKSTSVQFQKFKNSVLIVADVLGRSLLPPVNAVLGLVGRVVGRFSAWSEENPRLSAMISGTAASVIGLTLAGGGLLFTLGKLASWAPLFTSGFGILKTVFLGLGRVALPLVLTGVRAIGAALVANPVGAIVAGIATAAFLIWKYWEPIKGFFSNLWDGLKKGFAAWWEFHVSKLRKLGEIIGKVKGFFGFGSDEDSKGKEALASRGESAIRQAVAGSSAVYNNAQTTRTNQITINPQAGQSASEIADEVLWRLGQDQDSLAGGALYD